MELEDGSRKLALTLGFVRFSIEIVSFGLKGVRCLVSVHFLRFSPKKKLIRIHILSNICWFKILPGVGK